MYLPKSKYSKPLYTRGNEYLLSNDTFYTGHGDDRIYGNDGNDKIIQNGSGTQYYDGGEGNDTIEINTSWLSSLNNNYPYKVEIDFLIRSNRSSIEIIWFFDLLFETAIISLSTTCKLL